MKIIKFVSSAKYRIDEQFQSWQFFEILIIFKKIWILEIRNFFQFEKLVDF